VSEAVQRVRRRRNSLRCAAVAAATGLLLSASLGLSANADETPTATSTASSSPTSSASPTGTSDGTASESSTAADSPTGSGSDSPTTSPTSDPTDTSSGTPTSTPSGTTPPVSTGSNVPPVNQPGPKPKPTPTPKPSPSSAPDPGDGETALSPSELAQQLAQAQSLQAQLFASDARLATISARMMQLSAQSSLALQALQTAQREEQQALTTQTLQQQRLADLQARAAELKLQLGRWARAAYVSGGTLARYQAFLSALQATRTDQVGNSLFLINYVGRGEDQALREADTLASVQQIVSQQADQAAAQATAARLAAQAASATADAALAQQRQLLAAEQAAQAARLGTAGYTLSLLGNTNAANRLVARAELAALHAGLTSAGASCRPGVTKSSVAGFGNGQIPAAALCPLWGAPGQLLRADAAAAFARLSKAYAQQFGRPICVTDSYRSFSQQVALYATKPNLAARPGTSNHGWGVAVDLCGGVQSFGTAEHNWLFTHAPLYGWFHPAWAEPTGSRPEPWHWEFAH
jgi:D-alanyl-D-alanine carboxypeptidase